MKLEDALSDTAKTALNRLKNRAVQAATAGDSNRALDCLAEAVRIIRKVAESSSSVAREYVLRAIEINNECDRCEADRILISALADIENAETEVEADHIWEQSTRVDAAERLVPDRDPNGSMTLVLAHRRNTT